MNTLRMAPLTALLILCWSQSLFAEEATGWDYKNKNAFVTQCHQRAMQELRPFIKGIFIEVMDETQFSVYQLNSSQHLAQSCHCLVTRIANQFDYADLTKKRAEVDDFAEPLFLQGGACAINYQDLLRDVQAQLGGR